MQWLQIRVVLKQCFLLDIFITVILHVIVSTSVNGSQCVNISNQMSCILMYLRIPNWLTKMSKVLDASPVVLVTNKVRIMLVGAEMQNFTVQKVEVHCFPVVSVKCQKNNVFHTCVVM